MSLTVKNCSAGYGNKIVVDDVSFEINPGEFCALIGLNGCGKTTLLKAICSLLSKRNGMVKVNEQSVEKLNEKQLSKLISFIPQRMSLIEGQTALDVVMMGFNPYLGIFENPSEKQKRTALEVMEKIGIPDKQNEDFNHLSEGYKQLVILARTLVQNTPVMLMDEPDSALDYVNKNMILTKIKDIVHTEKKSSLISIHDPLSAIRYCDRLLIMKEGKIIKDFYTCNTAKEEIEKSFALIYGDLDLFTW